MDACFSFYWNSFSSIFSLTHSTFWNIFIYKLNKKTPIYKFSDFPCCNMKCIFYWFFIEILFRMIIFFSASKYSKRVLFFYIFCVLSTNSLLRIRNYSTICLFLNFIFFSQKRVEKVCIFFSNNCWKFVCIIILIFRTFKIYFSYFFSYHLTLRIYDNNIFWNSIEIYFTKK